MSAEGLKKALAGLSLLSVGTTAPPAGQSATQAAPRLPPELIIEVVKRVPLFYDYGDRYTVDIGRLRGFASLRLASKLIRTAAEEVHPEEMIVMANRFVASFLFGPASRHTNKDYARVDSILLQSTALAIDNNEEADFTRSPLTLLRHVLEKSHRLRQLQLWWVDLSPATLERVPLGSCNSLRDVEIISLPDHKPGRGLIRALAGATQLERLRINWGKLDEKDFRVLDLVRWTQLEQLRLEEVNLTSTSSIGLVRSLNTLSLSASPIGTEGVRDLQIHQLDRLEGLTLHDCGLESAALEFLAIGRHPRLSMVNLTLNPIGGRGGFEQLELGRSSTLRELHLISCGITDGDLLSLLPTTTSLEVLDLSHNTLITSIGIERLRVGASRLKKLSLGDCSRVDDTAILALDMSRAGLEELDVSETKITAEGIKSMCLDTNTKLRRLDVGFANLGSAAGPFFHLRTNTTLEHLRLTGTGVNIATLGLAANSSLRHLELGELPLATRHHIVGLGPHSLQFSFVY